MTQLARFYWARYQGALEDICHDKTDAAVDTCYALLLQPELSPFIRALVNTTLATTPSIRRHPDKMIFVNRAKAILADLRTWPKVNNSDSDLDFLQKSFDDAEADVKEELARAQASQDSEEGDQDVATEEGGQSAGVVPQVVAGERRIGETGSPDAA